MGTLQRNLIPCLEECWERRLTEKEQQLVSILEVLQIEKFAGRPTQQFGRKPWERQALARAFVGKAVNNHPTTCATIEALKASPVFRRLCGFVRRGDVPSESTFSRALRHLPVMGLGEKVHQALVEQWVKPELVDISRTPPPLRVEIPRPGRDASNRVPLKRSAAIGTRCRTQSKPFRVPTGNPPQSPAYAGACDVGRRRTPGL